MAHGKAVALTLVSGVFVAVGLIRTLVVPSAFAISNPLRSLDLGANHGVSDNRQPNGGSSVMGNMVASMMVTAGFVVAGIARRPNTRIDRCVVKVKPTEQPDDVEALVKQTVSTMASAVLLAGSIPGDAGAYPIFAQQNYKDPREATGKLACANCHLASKQIDVRLPHEVLSDTIFKTYIDIPLKYEKRKQPLADGSKGALNVGAIAVMPEGWKLAPKNRLPKPIKKEMKGLSWAIYSKEHPEIVVAGPVPGNKYSRMTLPVLAPDPSTDKNNPFGKYTFFYGGNRGRGQVYPEGNNSNNNQFSANATGTVTAIDGLKVSITKADGTIKVVECGAGADIVVEVGEVVKNGEPITTNPNVGGFGQEEKELVLQDMNRVYAYCAIGTSIFFAQLAFVLKKKQFEKVQLAEGF